jgi:hypothetical protein
MEANGGVGLMEMRQNTLGHFEWLGKRKTLGRYSICCHGLSGGSRTGGDGELRRGLIGSLSIILQSTVLAHH